MDQPDTARKAAGLPGEQPGGSVLAGFMSVRHELESSERRESSMRKCLHKTWL